MPGTGRHSVVIAITALFALGLGPPARADGFRGGLSEALGEHFEAAPEIDASLRRGAPRHGSGAKDALLRWNRIAIDASGLDHTPVAPGESRVFGEQYGPARASRAMAIVHIAIFDAVNAIAGGYRSYTGPFPGAPGRLPGRRHRAGGARYAGRAVSLPERELRRPARGRPGPDRIPEGARPEERNPARRVSRPRRS